MDTTPPKKSFLSGLIGDIGVDTKVGFSSSSLYQAGAVIFIAGALIILAYFTFSKLLK